MAELNKMQSPAEIPWQLVATNALKSGKNLPSFTTLSVFLHEPQDRSLLENYPNDRIVYFKFTVSVSPIRPEGRRKFADIIFQEGLPVKHFNLNLKISSVDKETGSRLKPYFLSASPVRREIIETGVIGAGLIEGESTGLSIGKSATELHETLSAQTTSKTSGGGGGGGIPGVGLFTGIPLGAGGGYSSKTTSTSVDSERNYNQYIETTERKASEERKELLSHMTNVRNVLSLLSARFIGSPYLKFRLSPRPLTTLSADPSDPNLWYSQFLQYMSGGIEGIQEFFAVAVLPRDESKFVLTADTYTYALWDDKPAPRQRHTITIEDVLDYLNEVYPPGTPLEALDIAIPNNNFVRPVVHGWLQQASLNGSKYISLYYADLPELAFGSFLIPNPAIEIFNIVDTNRLSKMYAKYAWSPYKFLSELKLEVANYNYEKELSRHPLKDGVIISEDGDLDVTIDFGEKETDELSIIQNTKDTDYKLHEVDADPRPSYTFLPQVRTFTPVYFKPTQQVVEWNNIQQRLTDRLDNREEAIIKPFTFVHPKVINILLKTWMKMADNAVQNISLAQIATVFRLEEYLIETLQKAKITNLKQLSQALLAIPRIVQINARIEEFKHELPSEESKKIRAIESPFEEREYERIIGQIRHIFENSN